MRKPILAVVAAWISILVVALPSVVHAQGRGEGQGRARPQMQQQQQQQQQPDFRRGGGFSGMLRDIAGARLDRAHADRRSDGPPPANDKNPRRR